MITRKKLWFGRLMSALPALLLAFSGAMKLFQPPGLEQGFDHLGWPVSLALRLGILELACTIIYVVPRTSILGAILLTGYLGGAVATHVRVGDPFLVQVLLGALVWGGLYVRDPRLQAILPLTRPDRRNDLRSLTG